MLLGSNGFTVNWWAGPTSAPMKESGALFIFGSTNWDYCNWANKTINPTGNFDSILLVALGGELWGMDDLQFDFTPIPLPASLLLLGTGLIPLMKLRRKSRK